MKYLAEAPFEEAMEVFYRKVSPQPKTHRIWTGDFMGACTHDIACPVCFDAHAVIHRNVTPGQGSQIVQPCWKCQESGWRVIKLPRWLLKLLGASK